MKVAFFGDRHVAQRLPRYAEAVRVWEWAIDDAIEQGVEGFVGLGDVLESGPTTEDIAVVSRLYQHMLEHGWVIEVQGNHEPHGGLQWVQQIGRSRMPGAGPVVHPLVAWNEVTVFMPPRTIGQLDPVVFLMLPYCRRGHRPYAPAGDESLEAYYTEAAQVVGRMVQNLRAANPYAHLIVVGHWTPQGARVTSSELELTAGKEMVVPVAYLEPATAVVLGHLHEAQALRGVCRQGGDVVVAGSMYRTTFAERDQEKSYVLAEIADGRMTWQRRTLPVRPMKEVRISGAECAAIVASLKDGTARDVKLIVEITPEDPVIYGELLAPLAELPGHYPWEIVRTEAPRTRASGIDEAESLVDEFALWLEATRRGVDPVQRERVLRHVERLSL